MSNINKTENLEETRVCKECGRELRMSEFRTKTIGWTTHTYHVCNECFKNNSQHHLSPDNLLLQNSGDNTKDSNRQPYISYHSQSS